LKKNYVIQIILFYILFQSIIEIQIHPILAQPDKSDIALLGHIGYTDSSGYYHVTGIVKNIGNNTVQNVRVKITYYDADDEFIDDRFDLTMINILLSGRKSPFDIVLLDESQSNRIKNYEINITYSDTNKIGEYIKIVNHSSSIDESGRLRITGSIINLGESKTRNIEIISTYYDNNGNIAAANYVDLDPEFNYLNPNQVKEFEIILGEERTNLVDKYELTAESSLYALIETDNGNNNSIEPSSGSITVITDAVPDSSQEFRFNMPGQPDFILIDDETGSMKLKTFQDLSPDSYNLTEIVPEGWDRVHLDIVGDKDGGSIVDFRTGTVTIDLDAGEDVTVTFTNLRQYILTMNVVGGGSINRENSGPYNFGDRVKLSASADPNWAFLEWSGDLRGSINPDHVTITRNMDVTATFTQNEYTLILEIIGDGSVTKDPDHDLYIHGDSVGVTAIPADGWGFNEWVGDLTGNINPQNIFMNSDKAVTVNFERTNGTTPNWGLIIVSVTFLGAIIILFARKQIFSKKSS
jgi:hypothetical protein